MDIIRAHALTDLKDLEGQEEELRLPSFTTNDAWEIGTFLRDRIVRINKSAVINISLANSNQLLFHTAIGSGTSPDNDIWVARKRKTVLRWGHSSWYMHVKMQGDEAAFREKYALGGEAGTYAIHGGGFPVRVENVEGVVAVIVVSGLKQEEDHGFIVEALRSYLLNHPTDTASEIIFD